MLITWMLFIPQCLHSRVLFFAMSILLKYYIFVRTTYIYFEMLQEVLVEHRGENNELI